MNILKPSENTVYDNLYAKPALIDDWSPSSVVVLFCVRGIKYYGQFNYQERTWTTLPSDEKKRTFIDNEVQYWFYCPEYKEIFKVHSGVNENSKNRSIEFNPNKEENSIYSKTPFITGDKKPPEDSNFENVAERVKNILYDKLLCDKDEINLYDTLVGDLGADSLDIVEIMMGLESEFNIFIADDDIGGITTVRDCVEYVLKKLK